MDAFTDLLLKLYLENTMVEKPSLLSSFLLTYTLVTLTATPVLLMHADTGQKT